MTQNIITLTLGILLFASCKQAENKKTASAIVDSTKSNKVGDTLNYAIIPYDTTDLWIKDWIFNKSKQADLNSEDIKNIDILLSDCMKTYNTTEPQKELNKIDLKRYRRQYIAVTNIRQEKEVWVNCFCNGGLNYWKKEIVRVADGGKCFFNLKINLSKKTYYDLRFNSNG